MKDYGLLRSWWLAFARRAARAYVAGPELEDAVRVCSRLFHDGIRTTLCYWNYHDDSPQFVSDSCLKAVNALSDYDSCLSIKAPALQFRQELLLPVLDRARRRQLGIHFDSHGCDAADQTLGMTSQSLRRYRKLSLTLPGRWRRSLRDADWAAESGLRVRVVKGQWEDPVAPGLDLASGFLAVVGRLAGRACQVAVASHDIPLARRALEILRAAGTSCELELLFGLRLVPGLRLAREMDVPVRVYIPYGRAWLPYCVSQAAGNPRFLWWVLRDFCLGGNFRIPESLSAPPPPRTRTLGWNTPVEAPAFNPRES